MTFKAGDIVSNKRGFFYTTSVNEIFLIITYEQETVSDDYISECVMLLSSTGQIVKTVWFSHLTHFDEIFDAINKC